MGDTDIDGFFSTARVTGVEGDLATGAASYREFLYAQDDPVLADHRGLDYARFAAEKTKPAFVRELLAGWEEQYREPYVGVTTDGSVREGLYRPAAEPGPNDPGMVAAAQGALLMLSGAEREALCHPIDAPEWRAWSNPEFLIHRVGLRLEELAEAKAEALLGLVRASLSQEGYARVREAMDLNGFLGELTGLPRILGPLSYQFALYGTPSLTAPWGWQLFGHHVAVHVVVAGGRETIAPVFLGAEPADTAGEREPLFGRRERLAVEMASSLTPAQRAKAVLYASVLDPAMPAGRVHPADERHVAGAFQDNRVVPYEGLNAWELDDGQRRSLYGIIEDALLLLPERERARTMRLVGAHLDDTWVSWYGPTDGSGPFYLRVQSPVILTEVDHHAGVWLSNRTPERFHVHTTLRHPNGGDYGGLLRAPA